MLHEPMPSELAGAPRWLSPDTSRARATAGADSDSARRRSRAPRLREMVRTGLRCALLRLRSLTQFHMAWW
ncbi:hypothetical protein A9X00_00175 [Mycobacterium sp. 1245805.9]|nr:hypothetical protein A9X00_00175 [Mycobacterium sp. 1245805.9]